MRETGQSFFKPPASTKMSKITLYCEYTTYAAFEAEWTQHRAKRKALKHDPLWQAADQFLGQIDSDIRNELNRQKNYKVTREDAYQWKRNLNLAEAGPQFLKFLTHPQYKTGPYNSIIQPSPTVQITADSIIASPEALTITQIRERSDQFPAINAWIIKQLRTQTLATIMCAACKASDRGGCHLIPKNRPACHCNPCSCKGWLQPISIALLSRVESALTRKQQARKRKISLISRSALPPPPA